MGFELVHDAISAILGVALGLGHQRVSTHLRNRLLKKVLPFITEPVHVFLPIETTPGAGSGYSGYGDLLALSLLMNAIHKLSGSTTSVIFHGSQAEFETVQSENIVVIGGGKYNAVFRQVIEKLVVPLHFFDTPTDNFAEIRNAEGTVRFSPSYASDKSVTEDLGLLVRARNPWAIDKWVVIAAGSHAYGSAAAMDFLLSSTGLGELRRHLDVNCEAIVRTSVRNHLISRTSLQSKVVRF